VAKKSKRSSLAIWWDGARPQNRFFKIPIKFRGMAVSRFGLGDSSSYMPELGLVVGERVVGFGEIMVVAVVTKPFGSREAELRDARV
jgi:hypothetical protein